MTRITQSSTSPSWTVGGIVKAAGRGAAAVLLFSSRDAYATAGRALLDCSPGLPPPPVTGLAPAMPPSVALAPSMATPPSMTPPVMTPPATPPSAPPTLCLPAIGYGLNCAFQAIQQGFVQDVESGALPVFPNGGATDATSYANFVSGQWTQAFNQLTASDLQRSCAPVAPTPTLAPAAAPTLAPTSAPSPAPITLPLGIFVQPPSPLPRDGFLVAVGHQNLTTLADPMFAEICLSNFPSQLQDTCDNGGLRASLPGSQTPFDAMNTALTLAQNATPGNPADYQDAATALLVAYTRLIQGVGDPDCDRATLAQALRDMLNQQNVVSLVQNNAANFNSTVVTTFEDVLRSVTHSPPYSACSN